ncbi:MAG: flippase-like domain-containing protein [Saprospiraceae bacterium]|nr:flippase-like domain-containing protein [Saprospiraceae bacterium]MDP4821863.1 flippase-like domain-containing protein [Saprospiraceae bacterium]
MSGKFLLHASVKVVILSLLLYALYVQVFATHSLHTLRQAFLLELRDPVWWYAGLAIALMPVNWLLETFKWQVLLRPELRLPLGKALKAVLGGVAVSLFMPNRTGEYAGRLLLTDATHNWRVVLATLMGSLAQIIVLTGLGIVGAGFFVWYVADWELPGAVQVWVLLILGWLGGVWLYLHSRSVVAGLRRLPLGNRLDNYLAPLWTHGSCTTPQLVFALWLAFLRYAVYAGQYLLLLEFFGIHPGFWQGASGIATIFLLQTGIPLPPFGALLARSEIALLVWSVFEANEISILSATFALFIINLALPSLWGAFFIFRTNVLKSIGYEKNQSTE